MNMFRELNEVETVEFQKWARENYLVGSTINSAWHPVVVKECETINEEANCSTWLIEL